MSEKSQRTNSKDTDITGVLVGVIIVAMGILIATATQQFISQSTSTSSRASARRDSANDTWCKQNKPLSGDTTTTDVYLASKDICINTLLGCTTGPIDYTNTFSSSALADKSNCYGLKRCCRAGTISDLGKGRCQKNAKNVYNNPAADCFASSASCEERWGKSAVTSIKCAYQAGNSPFRGIYEGVCCDPPSGTTDTNCGDNHINCLTEFGDGISAKDFGDGKPADSITTLQKGKKNTDIYGKALTATCGKKVNEREYVCAYRWTSEHTLDVNTCDGQQFTYPVTIGGKPTCFATKKGPSSDYQGGKVCVLYSYGELSKGQTCRSMMGKEK